MKARTWGIGCLIVLLGFLCLFVVIGALGVLSSREIVVGAIIIGLPIAVITSHLDYLDSLDRSDHDE